MALTESVSLPIGWEATRFLLQAINGKNYNLEDLKGEKGTVVVFTCNHCPYAQAAWPFLIKLAKEYMKKEIAFIAINPNDESQYPEDSFEMMKKLVDQLGVNFPYLQDKSQNVAKEYKARCTPDIYVLDSQLKLYYHGRINDNLQNPEMITSQDLENAVNRLLSGKKPPEEQIPSMGCSIKWK